MKNISMVMMMAVDTPCAQHEEVIQDHSRKIAKLESRADYKEKMIDSIDLKFEKMDKKIDELLDGFNDFKIQSNKDDTKLELRLKAIETKQETQEDLIKENRDKANQHLAILGVVLSALMLILNFMR